MFIAGLRAVTQSFSECRGSSVRSGPPQLLPPRPVPTAVPLRPRVARPPLAELAASWHAQRLEVPRPNGHAWRLDSRQESLYLPNPRKRRRCLPPVRGVPPSDGAPLRRPWQAAQSRKAESPVKTTLAVKSCSELPSYLARSSALRQSYSLCLLVCPVGVLLSFIADECQLVLQLRDRALHFISIRR